MENLLFLRRRCHPSAPDCPGPGIFLAVRRVRVRVARIWPLAADDTVDRNDVFWSGSGGVGFSGGCTT
jgi:hypothetical protein